MAMLFGATLFFGITTALCVPYFYAYCKQSLDVSVQESDVTETEEESENRENVLVHSVQFKESLERGKTKEMKDTSINTIETMASDATFYKHLAPITENSQEVRKKCFLTASTQTQTTTQTFTQKFTETSTQTNTQPSNITIYPTDFSSSLTKTREQLKVKADVKNSNFESQKTLDERNVNNHATKNNLLKKRQFRKKEKEIESWKKAKTVWHSIKSKLSSSEDSNRTNILSVPSGSTSSQGLRTSDGTSSEGNNLLASKLPSQPSFIHSTLLDSTSKVALTLHEANGPPLIHVDSPRGSKTSLTISVRNLFSPGISHPQSKAYLIDIEQTPCSNDQSANLIQQCSFRTYKKSPEMLGAIENRVKEESRRLSSVF